MATTFPRSALESTIPARFAQMVETHRDRIAVRFERVELTYSELDDRARSVSAKLQAAVGQHPQAVAVALPQSIDLAVAIMGIIQSGNWYVPIDPRSAPHVLRGMLGFAEAAVVLTDDASHEAVRENCPRSCRAIRFRDCVALPVEQHGFSPDAMAYVYFTSGTTGRPKGVMDTHRNVLHNIMRYTNALQIAPGDRLTLLQSSTFSGAVSNVFGALLSGATLLMYDTATRGVGAALARWIEAEGPTIYHSVPTIFRSICRGDRVFPSVRVARLEGDAAAPGDVGLFRSHFASDAVLVNGLGTTETGICRQYFVRSETRVPPDTLPVGYGVEDMDVRVTDTRGATVAAGVIGEIVVRSSYLSQGYWCDDVRTDAAFRGEGPQREYRTGDLGRMHADGCLEHLGRKDDRVKLAGAWVDTPAIEAVIAAMPSVREAAVAVEETEAGDAILAAYVVPVEDASPTYDELRAAVASHFDSHEIPARAWSMSSLPTTPHGKIDRLALRPSNASRLPHEGDFVALHGVVETTLAAIWCEVLELERVGARDHFVRLGGSSLQAVRIAMEVETRLDKQVSMTTLMEAPTIAELATAMESSARVTATTSLVAVQPRGSATPLFCVHDLESDPFLFAQLARHLGDDQPVYGLRYSGNERLDQMPRTFHELAKLYVHDLRTVQPQGPYRITGFCFGGVVALAVTQLLQAAGERVELLTLFNVTPHDLFALVSPDAQRRFRSDWLARVRYVAAKPDAPLWVWRKFTRRVADVGWRLALPWADRLTPGDEKPSAEHLRAALLAAFEEFEPTAFDGHTVLFAAGETLPLYSQDAAAAWARLTTGRLDVHVSPRDGYSMLVEPDVRTVAQRLTESLREPQS